MTNRSLRDPRYFLTNSNAVEVMVTRKGDAETTNAQGQLVDLSRRGVQVRIQEPLERGERVRLTISAEASGLEIHSYARIRWIELDRRNEWLVGCALEDHLEDQSLDSLAKDGAVERRHDEREPVSSFTAEIKIELEPEFKTVQILDLSAGGFSALASDLTAKPGDRVLLEMQDDSERQLIPARVAWINDFESGQAIGCEFTDEEDHLLVRSAAFGAREAIRSMPRRDTNQWPMIGAGIVLIIVLFQLFWL